MTHPRPISDGVYDVLLKDFIHFHLFFAFGAALSSVALLIVADLCFDALLRTHVARGGPSNPMARRACFVFAGASAAFALIWAMLAVVNLSTAIAPSSGLANMLTSIGSGHRSQPTAFDRAVHVWLASDTPALPRVVSDAVARRLAWQRPKAITSGLTLVGLALGAAGLWRRLASSDPRIRAAAPRSRLLMWGVYLAVPLIFLATVFTLANAQACLAPLLLTLSAR